MSNHEFVTYSVSGLEKQGIAFDAALPQQFFDNLERLTKHNPMGHVVYAYPPGYPMGWPLAVDAAGAVMLGAFDASFGTEYAQGMEEGNG